MRNPASAHRSFSAVQLLEDFAAKHQLFVNQAHQAAPIADLPRLLQNLTSAGAGGAQDDVERYVPYITVAGILVVVTVWLGARSALAGKRRTGRQAEEGGPSGHSPLVWLGTLATASGLLLSFQLGLGLLSGSLTLLADMAHAAGDVVTYVAAYVAEKAKQDLSRRAAAPHTVASIDLVAGGVSTALVAVTGVKAMVDAVERLGGVSGSQGDFQLVGPALLTFAVVTAVVNSGLLVFRFYDSPQAAGAEQQLVADEAAELAEEAGRLEGMPPPPPPAAADRPPPPPGPTAQRVRARASASGGASTKWLHAAFHPGCTGIDGGDCAHSGGGGGGPAAGGEEAGPPAAPPPPASDAPAAGQPGSQAAQAASNLNVYGASLHLATDVVRSLLVLATGVLLQTGAVSDAAKADAVCALLVGACILAGSAFFLYTSVARIWACLHGLLTGKGRRET